MAAGLFFLVENSKNQRPGLLRTVGGGFAYEEYRADQYWKADGETGQVKYGKVCGVSGKDDSEVWGFCFG